MTPREMERAMSVLPEQGARAGRDELAEMMRKFPDSGRGLHSDPHP